MQPPESAGIMIDQREELIVSPAAADVSPSLRTARFLRPTATNHHDLPKLPESALHRPCQAPRASALNITFQGWRSRPGNWATWVDKMASSHHLTWKKAGIYDPVLNSTCSIKRNTELIIGLAERWCCDTKSFIFPWGEASVTLEDVMVLGGFYVVGSPVFKPLVSERLKKIESSLKDARIEIVRTKAKKASPSLWMEKFNSSSSSSSSELEHQAFLVCWLSRYVFVNARETIRENLIPMAIHLARGNRIALAPAVLATIYKDLCSLKHAIVSSPNLPKDEILALTLWSPLQLLQAWAFERFPQIRSDPNVLKSGEPRLFQWRDVSGPKVENFGLALDTAKHSFEWRPYTNPIKNWKLPKFYPEKESDVSLDARVDKEMESFARCMRTAELVGPDCVEQYLPVRVAMQFGMDQDVPGSVVRSTNTPEIAWNHYIESLGDVKLWIPPRSFRGGVTVRYSLWWEQSVGELKNGDAKKLTRRSRKKRPRPLTEKQQQGDGNMSSCTGSHGKKEITVSPGTDHDAFTTPNGHRRSSRRRKADNDDDEFIPTDSNSPVLRSKSMVQLLGEHTESGNDGSTLPGSDGGRVSKRSRKVVSGMKNKDVTVDVPVDNIKEESHSSSKRKKEKAADTKDNGEAASFVQTSRRSRKPVQKIKTPAVDQLDRGEGAAGVCNDPTIAEMIRSAANKQNGTRHDEEVHNSPSFSSTVADDEATNQLESLVALAERVVQDEEEEAGGGSGYKIPAPQSNNKGKEVVLFEAIGEANGDGTNATVCGSGTSKLTLEDRLSRLERLVKGLQTAK